LLNIKPVWFFIVNKEEEDLYSIAGNYADMEAVTGVT